MIEIICGEKGKGKTKELIDKANESIKTCNGSIVYLDKDVSNMYELNNRIRLINVSDYPITDAFEFYGFLCGIVSRDNDLEEIYVDSFLTNANIVSDSQILSVVRKLELLSDKFKVKIILSISKNVKELAPELKSKIILSI